MKRAAKVCWIGFVFSTIVVAAVAGLLVYFTAFRPDDASATGSDALQPITEDPTAEQPDAPVSDGETSLVDHLAHAVPGFEYRVVDFDGDGFEFVQLDGSRSHTHYFDEGPPAVIGKLVEQKWFQNETKEQIATGTSPLVNFPVGKTVVGLTVSDNFRDSHTGYATILVEEPITKGAYCYYYPEDPSTSLTLPPTVASGIRPIFATRTDTIAFKDDADFPSQFSARNFQARCSFILDGGTKISFSLDHFGPVRLHNRAAVVYENLSNDQQSTSFDLDLPEGRQVFDLLYYRSSPSGAALTLDIGEQPLQHDLSKRLPIITGIDPASSTLGGGGTIRIRGLNLVNNIKIHFGDTVLDVIEDVSSDVQVFVKVPSTNTAGSVPVSAKNAVGSSNAKDFMYSANGRPPVRFRQSSITKGNSGQTFALALITGIKFGPDSRLYASAINNRVYSFDIDPQMRASDLCTTPPLGRFRSILGLAFNPADEEVKLYVSASVLDWKSKERLDTEFAWANGQILLLMKNVNGNCLDKVGDPVITGLPVSNHDHGVNGLVFDNDGKLHIQVGGSTNAGHNDAESRLGGIDETPLSGASLIADVNKPNFDGNVLYDKADPGTARQIGGDVSVFSPGWRNSFGVNIHSNGYLYATDNGASVGFGDKSVSCGDFEKLVGEKLDDKLGKVEEGKYFGHPNRNRGRDDPRQCVFRDTGETSDENYRAPMATFESSTDGVVEYSANVFNGELRGDLLCSKYSTEASPGKVFRMQLDGKGDLSTGPDELWPASGLSMEVTPWGHILMARVYKQEVMVLTPLYDVGILPTIIAVTPVRGPKAGGNVVLISGHAFGEKPVGIFGGEECTDVHDVVRRGDFSMFRCRVPAGSGPGRVAVTGVADGVEVRGEVDYRYMNV